jgi:hypothetical protein
MIIKINQKNQKNIVINNQMNHNSKKMIINKKNMKNLKK